MLYYSDTGQVQMACDICHVHTLFYATLSDLYAAVNFNAKMNTDAGTNGWMTGPGRMITGPGYEPTCTLDPSKHACGRCKGTVPGLVWQTLPNKLPVGGRKKFGDAAETSRDEDMVMNKPVEQIFKDATPTPIVPRVFPRNEIDFSNDIKPYGEAAENGPG